jgi:light-regulated signal transduction histidine kinase (bacteriophytochrome)
MSSVISCPMAKQDKIDKINEELKEKLFEISQQNQLLNFQQREIFDKSEELKIQSEEIKAINESLEERVRERTRVLEEKNKQLAEYAFINSHVLRAPISTMMGLINLISYSSLPLEDQRIYEHLIETTKVLDSIVYRINDAIENGSQLDRTLIEPEREFLPMK